MRPTPLLLIALVLLCAPAHAQGRPDPTPLAALYADALLPAAALPTLAAAPLDRAALAAEDALREAQGQPPRFAVPQPVLLTPDHHGVWEELDDGTSVWRLRVSAPGAASLSLGFGRYSMPEGGRLQLYSPDFEQVMRPFGTEDNAGHGELWTALLEVDEIVVEVSLPSAARPGLELELSSLNVGYRPFGQLGKAGGDKSGACNVDVVCADGVGWENEIRSVGGYSTGGSIFCTGFMVNNTAQDGTPYFQTADHCGIDANNAASVVVYWNFETSCCGASANGQLDQFQTGATFRAAYTPSDMTLIELGGLPDPEWEVAYAGWDRSGSAPSSAVAIHHPSGDEKRISFENHALSTTSYYASASPGDGSHLRVADWDTGTTEPGSSGSPLFDPNHRVIGQLHGGDAACGNNDPDWYGKFSVSWSGGGSSATRLSDWLDPGATGALQLDTLAHVDPPATVQQSWNMSSDPGWSADAGWAWGTPTGGGGAYGAPDPTSGYNGGPVMGYELSGDYANDLPERHVTTPAIDASQFQDTHVAFRRWLNVEQPQYDHAHLRVSTDGTNWTPVWENTREVCDSLWREVAYDISAVADGAPNVYLRWTMGVTDSSWQYSGWNLDEVEIRALPEPGTILGLPAALVALAVLARRRAPTPP